MRQRPDGKPTSRKRIGESIKPLRQNGFRAKRRAGKHRALPLPTVPPRILAGSDPLQRARGHSASCVALSRQGAISSCDCSVRPLEDPAVIAGLILRFVRTSGGRKVPLPTSLIEPLFRLLQSGDPTCLVIAAWLIDLGLLEARILETRRGGTR
ncbi:MAG: hypothetical protein IBJ07_08725 [Rhizobiaceae bacterium]|nr:hypothetical protein [Rhizobiaceae bacterium]